MLKWLKWAFIRKHRSPSLFESMVFAFINHRNMAAYIHENGGCDVQMMSPSRELRRRYLIRIDDNPHVWAILEQYVKGELLNKQQVIDQINEDAKQKAHASR